jgi:hypothetical protein
MTRRASKMSRRPGTPRESRGKIKPLGSLKKDNARLSTTARSDPIPPSGSKTDSPRGNLAEIEVDFAELEDGSLVEMIEDPDIPTKSLLAVYKDGAVQCVEKWRNGGRVLIPLPRAGQVLKHISLPAGSESYVGLEELKGDVASFFNSCLEVDLRWRILMTAFVFSSWLPERLPVAPYLALLGPPGSGKTTAIRILSLLCRRGLPTSDITSAAFYDVCHSLRPTLLIDETITAGHPRTLLHLLRSSNSPGFVSLRKDKAQMAYGPKVLAWIQLPNDAALNSRCIIIPMHKTSRADLVSPVDIKMLQFARKMRMRLLQFRFEHYRSRSIPRVPAGVRLSSRALDLYRALALPFGENQEFCEMLARLIAEQRQFQPRLLSATQASAVRVLCILIHVDPSQAGYKLSGLTTLMKEDLASRGEPSMLNERKMGDILTSLGLTNRSRTNIGYVLWLERSDRVRIHEMVRDYEVDGTGPNPNCDICTETNTASPVSSILEAADENQVRPDEANREHHEHRERCERGPVAASRAANRRPKHVRSRQS